MDLNVRIADIETLKCMFLYVDYNPFTGEYTEFEISDERNDLDAMCKYLVDRDWDYMVTFNGLNFDAQVIQYILNSQQKWFNKSNWQIINLIYKKSQDVISDTMAGLFPPYREEQLTVPQIDLFKILHYDNKAKMTSLKWISFMIDSKNVEEMPYHHTSTSLTREQMDEVIHYCKNDVEVTHNLYKYVTGEVEHEFYKGKNKIQDRFDSIEEWNLPTKALNFSDVKIGDEINKLGYMELTGKTYNDLYQMKLNRKTTAGFSFGDCIPKYVKFKTEEFKQFYNQLKPVRVNLGGGKQEFNLTYNGTKYTIARGGIHSNEKNRIVSSSDKEIILDADVGSQYPNAIRKRELYPSHLGKHWLSNYTKTIKLRLEYKGKSKTNRKYKSLSEMLKLALNGGAFGMLNQKNSWQYDPFALHKCTIGNQFEILMLIEMLELEGIHCISANTDGIVCLFDRDLQPKYYDICHQWEEIVGNTEMGNLEYTEYSKLIQESVNHYIAIKPDGEIKVKGRFDVDVELHKNNTDKIGRIERLAIQNYFTKAIPIEETILKHENIFDFCIGLKASRDYHYETVDIITGEATVYQRLVRFYISEKGKRLLKIKNENSDAPGAKLTKIAGENLITIFNNSYILPMEGYDINYSYYIKNAKEVIDKIEKGGKKKISKRTIQTSKEQLSLF